MNLQADHILFEQTKKGDEKAFEALFRAYYPLLCHFATHLIKDASAAEEIVQELFVKLWEKKEDTSIESSVKNYLYRAVKNQCLNYARHQKIKDEFIKASLSEQNLHMDDNLDSQTELILKIEKSIAALPEKRREIFRLSRQEGLKYREIALKLNVSIKTVETQMGFALKSLREMLKDFFPVL